MTAQTTCRRGGAVDLEALAGMDGADLLRLARSAGLSVRVARVVECPRPVLTIAGAWEQRHLIVALLQHGAAIRAALRAERGK
jgi:hypothetical protein